MNDLLSRNLNRAVAGQTVMDEPTNAPKWNTKLAIKNKKDELDASIKKMGDIDDDINELPGTRQVKVMRAMWLRKVRGRLRNR